MSADLLDKAAGAVESLKRAGADEAWASVAQARNVEFSYRDGVLEKVQDTTAQGLAVAIYANGRYSSHQTTDLKEERLDGFLAEAVAITGALEPDPQRKITPPELYRNRPEDDLELTDDRVLVLDREQRLAWCETLDEGARKHQRVISATSRVRTVSQSEASVSSNGFSGTAEGTACSLVQA